MLYKILRLSLSNSHYFLSFILFITKWAYPLNASSELSRFNILRILGFARYSFSKGFKLIHNSIYSLAFFRSYKVEPILEVIAYDLL